MRTEKEIRSEIDSLQRDYNAVPSSKRTLPEWIAVSYEILALKWVLEEIKELTRPYTLFKKEEKKAKIKEECPFHPENGGNCSLADSTYCHKRCHIRRRYEKR